MGTPSCRGPRKGRSQRAEPQFARAAALDRAAGKAHCAEEKPSEIGIYATNQRNSNKNRMI
ncbi:hypothetical protein C0Z20_21815 [Trinickia symbiotica]|nr:hypothetical protein C0Z20_21815 [Trinickia symbiotica]